MRHVISRYVTPCSVTLRYVTLYYAASRRLAFHGISLRCAATLQLQFVTMLYFMLRYNTLRNHYVEKSHIDALRIHKRFEQLKVLYIKNNDNILLQINCITRVAKS